MMEVPATRGNVVESADNIGIRRPGKGQLGTSYILYANTSIGCICRLMRQDLSRMRMEVAPRIMQKALSPN